MNKNLLEKHAKSFYWASFFLSKETFKKCSSLYNFCRTLDDIVDDNKELETKRENFLKFKKEFINKDFKNSIIKEMWLIIDSENIVKRVERFPQPLVQVQFIINFRPTSGRCGHQIFGPAVGVRLVISPP